MRLQTIQKKRNQFPRYNSIYGSHLSVADKVAGHGMLFRTFEGELMLALHSPNDTPNERPVFLKVGDDGKTLKLGR